jgi:nucleotide-binding universal stress UspA family protein
MALIRKMLVAVDGSEASLNAWREGCRLSHGERARIMAVTVAPTYEGDLNLVGVRNIEGMMNEPCDKAFAAAKEIAREEGIVAEHLGTTGEIHQRIVEVAAEYRCDLIVLGYDRRPALVRLLVGSAAPAVIATSPCDVLVIPRGTRFDWRTFLVVLGKPQATVRAAERALDFARAYGARLVVATADSTLTLRCTVPASVSPQGFQEWEQARFLGELTQQAESMNVRAQTVSLKGGPLSVATKLAKREQAGLTILDWAALTFQPAFVFERYLALALQGFPGPVLVVRGS